MSLLSALLVVAPLTNGAWTYIPSEGPWARDTPALAQDLLPAAIAADVVDHVLGTPTVQGGPPHSVTFLGERRQAGRFCERRVYLLVGDTLRRQIRSEPVTRVEVRLGLCPADGEATFAHVDPQVTMTEAKQALLWLASAQRKAESGDLLPFSVACGESEYLRSEGRSCEADPRHSLAGLTPERTFIIKRALDASRGGWSFWIKSGQAKGSVWMVDVTDPAPGMRGRIRLKLDLPHPF